MILSHFVLPGQATGCVSLFGSLLKIRIFTGCGEPSVHDSLLANEIWSAIWESAHGRAFEHGRLWRPERFFVVHAHFAFPSEMQNVHELQRRISRGFASAWTVIP